MRTSLGILLRHVIVGAHSAQQNPDWVRRLAGPLAAIEARLDAAAARLGAALSVDVAGLLDARPSRARDVRPHVPGVGPPARIVAARDGWLAIDLRRPDDVELVPAWLARWVDADAAGEDPWAAIARAGRRATGHELLAAADGFGLPVAVVGEVAAQSGAGLRSQAFGVAAPRSSLRGVRVVDLSSLWAGPLCGALLAAAGAHVTKVESRARPDAGRDDPTDLARHLNRSKDLVVVDLDSSTGREQLRRLVRSADVVIEGSRPRALRQLGIDADALLAAAGGPRTWVSITGFGLDQPDRVAFGDIAAAAGGLVTWDAGPPTSVPWDHRPPTRGPDRRSFPRAPAFLGDALADPLTGLAAAAAALEHLAAGGQARLDLSMAGVAAHVAALADLGHRPGPHGEALEPPPFRAAVPASSRWLDRGAAPEQTAGAHRRRRSPATQVLFSDVEVAGLRTSVLVDGDRIVAVDPAAADELVDRHRVTEVLDGRGGALLPGLHDHHVHLAATAALARSVVVGPPAVRTADDLARVLRAACEGVPPGDWIRAVGYHASTAGDLDRDGLDRLLPDRPVRVQDASGARWTVNSHGANLLGLDAGPTPAGVERDHHGRATGRLHRADGWLRDRLGPTDPLPFAALGRRLASYGVTGVTDTTPSAKVEDLDLLAAAARAGDLPQHLVLTGGFELADACCPPGASLGPVKLVVDDGQYPALDDLAGHIALAHRHARAVAVHCVTRTALVLTLAAFDLAGAVEGDRLEHGSVIAPEQLEPIRTHRLTVVTQPSFLADRGDRYLAEVDPDDLPHLYRCGTLLAAGIDVAFGSDAPHGDLDPWRSIAAAVERRTASGDAVGLHERIPAAAALERYLGTAAAPGGPARRVETGAPADLCLLHLPLADALRTPSAAHVRATYVRGTPRPVLTKFAISTTRVVLTTSVSKIRGPRGRKLF